MKLRVGALVAAPVIGGLLFLAAATEPSHAAGGCSGGVGLDSATYDCDWAYQEYLNQSSSGDGHVWSVVVQPANGGIRKDTLICTENGEDGIWNDVYMDGVDVGDVCVPNAAVPEVDVAQLAIREFKRLEWPGSTLIVQPKGNRTLVNFETIFYTDNSEATTQVVELAGRQVTIEATPVSYTWDFGDGAVETTQSPGHPHPKADVTHVYNAADPMSASVGTTYAGRFRIGNGDWQDIDETRAIAGAPVEIEVLEAKPQLVIP